MTVLLPNHVSAFYMKLYISGRSQVKYTYMISREHSHVVLPDHASLSHINKPKGIVIILRFFLTFFLCNVYSIDIQIHMYVAIVV